MSWPIGQKEWRMKFPEDVEFLRLRLEDGKGWVYSADDYDLVRQKLDQEHEHVFMRLKGREEVAILQRNANNRFYYCAPWDPNKPRLRDATSGRMHSVNGVLEAAYQSLRLVAKQGLAEGDKSRWAA